MSKDKKKRLINSESMHLYVLMSIIEKMKDLIIKDEEVSLDVKKKVLSLYLQYKFSHMALLKIQSRRSGYLYQLYENVKERFGII